MDKGTGGRDLTSSFCPQAWINGRFLPLSQIQLPITTFALHYGLGIMDGEKFYPRRGNRSLFKIREHIRRFINGCRSVTLDLEYSEDSLVNACRELVSQCEFNEGYVRQLAFAGGGDALGVAAESETIVTVIAWEKNCREKLPKIRAVFSPWGNDDGRMSDHKITGHYARGVILRRTLAVDGIDDVIFTDASGNVSEASAANIFCVVGEEVVTPPDSSAILPGITRDSLIELMRSLGIKTRTAALSRAEVLGASEVFLCASAGEMRVLSTLEDRSWDVFPVSERIYSEFRAALYGHDARFDHWFV